MSTPSIDIQVSKHSGFPPNIQGRTPPIIQSKIQRTAFVVSVSNGSDARSQRTEILLSDLGFIVKFVKPFDLDVIKASYPNESIEQTKVLSHMTTVLEIMKTAKEEWIYVFEDDIAHHEYVTLSSIVAHERTSTRMFYLGVCSGGWNWPWNWPWNSPECTREKCCGRCAHAMAFSATCRTEFLSFVESGLAPPSNYFDVLFEAYCLANDGFEVYGYEGKGQEGGHRGGFYQDRKEFKTGIG
jgi:hypothetical protein